MSDDKVEVFEITGDQAQAALRLMVFIDEFCSETVEVRQYYENQSTLLGDVATIHNWAKKNGLYHEENEDERRRQRY